MDYNDKETDIFTEPTDEEQLWLKELIDRDYERFQLPESLKSENLMHKLDEIEQEDAAKPKGKVVWLKYISAAACFALVLFGLNIFEKNGGMAKTSSNIAVTSAAAVTEAAPAAAANGADNAASPRTQALAAVFDESDIAEEAAEAPEEEIIDIEIPEQPSAESYDEIFSAISEMAAVQASQNKMMYSNFALAAPAANPPTAGGANADVAEDAVAADFGGVYSTNTQVKGVDEADIVKTDGTYIYHYRFDSSTGGANITISSARGLKQLSVIELPDYSEAEMYLSGDRLVVVQNMSDSAAKELADSLTEKVADYESAQTGDEVVVPDYAARKRHCPITEAIIFDISDRKAPKESSRYRQDGSYVSSRMSGGMLYLVSNKYIYSDISPYMPARYYLPYAGSKNELKALSADNIFLPPYCENPNYAVVTSLDILTGKGNTKAVLGMADEIMMSKNNLYLTATVYGEGRSYRNRSTGITRFAVTKDGLKYLADTKVDGYIDNQFSLDEHNLMLRVATTSYDDSGKTVNNLYVLDSSLKQMGAIKDLAPGERIYSVRYIGDMAYVVTFRETDPLFVIDLSDPASPTVKGQLKIPGFSEYLHPIDENTLIGLGNNTVTTKYGGVITDGLKLSLFDVSDPLDPKEKCSLILGNRGSESEALNNHKAFLYYPEKKLIGFPASIYTTYGATHDSPYSGESRLSFGGYIVIKVNDNSFDIVGTLSSTGENSLSGFMHSEPDDVIERAIYIGDTLYTLSGSNITAFSLNDFSRIGALKYQ